MSTATLEERLMAKVVWNGDEDECWEWAASRGSHGYGQISHNGRPVLAHRTAYEMFVGPIPKGLDLDHLCRNRGCINPSHLEPVTRGENLRRGEGPALATARQKAKTHCPKGHPYSGDNLIPRPNGWRSCRACTRANKQARRARQRAAGLTPT